MFLRISLLKNVIFGKLHCFGISSNLLQYELHNISTWPSSNGGTRNGRVRALGWARSDRLICNCKYSKVQQSQTKYFTTNSQVLQNFSRAVLRRLKKYFSDISKKKFRHFGILFGLFEKKEFSDISNIRFCPRGSRAKETTSHPWDRN